MRGIRSFATPQGEVQLLYSHTCSTLASSPRAGEGSGWIFRYMRDDADQAEASQGYSFSAQSHRHPSLGFFLFSLVLESCCILCNFYSLENYPSSFPHVSCKAIHHSSPPPAPATGHRCGQVCQSKTVTVPHLSKHSNWSRWTLDLSS